MIRRLRSLSIGALCCAAFVAIAAPARAAGHDDGQGGDVETVVFLRHGEKPPEGLGQLDCQGLNRALALPAVIAAQFGRPDAVFAPDPSVQRKDHGKRYDYVRPLATIEPTAIQFGLPVHTAYGVQDTKDLSAALVAPALRDKLVLVAWEHKAIPGLVRTLLAAPGGKAVDDDTVPKWSGSDFDSLYVVRLDWKKGTARFEHGHEGLDGRPVDCPCAQLPAAASGASAR